MKPHRYQNIDRIVETAKALGELTDDLVFVGGAAVGLLITDPAVPGVRITCDVDATVELASRVEFYRFQERLRDKGFTEAIGEKIICRWKRGDLVLDVMPTRGEILGFTNKWYGLAVENSQTISIDDIRIRLITAPYFLGTKIEAFLGRGEEDFLASHDLEDFVAVMDGRIEIVTDVSNAGGEIKSYLAERMSWFLRRDDFLDALPGHMFPDPGSQQRVSVVLERMRQIASIDSSNG
jgi:predicted nucleotidyltransferase